MEAARDDLDDVPGAGDERFRFGDGKWGGDIRDCEHLGPSVPFNGVPTTGRRRQIAKREARLLVCAPLDRD
jgi:hypothetical protein